MTDVPSGRAVVSASLALGVAVGLVGISFGVLAVANGLTVPQAMAMSLLVFTGASQFAAVGVLAGGGSGPAAVASGLLLAARNGVYGLALAPILQGSLGRRLLASQLVIDESTAMATAQPDRTSQARAFWTSGLAIFVCWNAGTLIGAVAGGALSDPAKLGLDAAFPAGFVVLIGPHLATRLGRIVALLGALLVLVTTPFLRPGMPILVAALAILVGLAAPVPAPRTPPAAPAAGPVEGAGPVDGAGPVEGAGPVDGAGPVEGAIEGPAAEP